MNNKTYIIMNTVDLTQKIIEESNISNETTIRYSLDKIKVVLSFPVKFPNSCAGVTRYTHAEILIEMAKVEWLAVIS